MPGKIFAGQLRVFPTPRHRVRTSLTQPLYLLADSQLLFRRDRGSAFLDGVRARLPRSPSAAYVGASNGDNPELYTVFTAAMEGLGITRTRMIPSAPTIADEAFLATADLVLLAGGDVEQGWRAMDASGVRKLLLRRHREGAMLIGVSAGAVQLGMLGWAAGDPSPERTFQTFGLVPFVIDAHAEAEDWPELRRVVRDRRGAVRGLGIPRGGGLVLHPDGAIEAVRHPAAEIVYQGSAESLNLLFPACP
jgi:peptidase E